MKFHLAVAAAFLMLSSALRGQEVVKTIYLPDSDGGLTWPQCVAFNPSNNSVYIGGQHGDCVVVVDAVSLNRVARIPTGRDVRALCYDATNNKIYCANNVSNTVTVIDGTKNVVIATVKVGNGPFALAYNPVRNAVYCANYGHYPKPGSNPSVTVIDCASDSVIADIHGVGVPLALCCNTKRNRVYCNDEFSDRVAVIDGASNKIVATVSQSSYGGTMCYNPANDRVYCSGGAVIDGMTNEVTATIRTKDLAALYLDPTKNRILCVAYNDITAIDCATDKLQTSKLGIPTCLFSLSWSYRSAESYQRRGISAICTDPGGDRLYCTREYSADLYVVDAKTWTVTDSVRLGGFPSELCCVPATNTVVSYDRVYGRVHLVNEDSARTVSDVMAGTPLYYDSVAGRMYCGSVAVDPRSGRVRSGVRLPTEPTVMCGNTADGKLYWVSYDKIVGLDQSTGETTVVSQGFGGHQSDVALCYEPSSNMIYCAMLGQIPGAVLVIDSKTGRVVDTIPLDAEPRYLCSNPAFRKVYCASWLDASVTVIDCVARKATATVKLEDRPGCLCCASSDGAMYIAGWDCDQLYVMNGATDAVVATVPVGPGGHLLQYSAHSNRVYCSNSDNTVSVIDASSRKVIKVIEVGEGPTAVALNPQAHTLYVANYLGSSISVIRDE